MLILCYWFSSLCCILVFKLDDYLPPGAVFYLNCSSKYFLVLFSRAKVFLMLWRFCASMRACVWLFVCDKHESSRGG